MTQKHKIQLFEEKQVRTVWDDEQEKWFFSIVDVCGVLTEQPDYDHAKNYWKVLKHRLVKEGNESVTNCNQLKLVSPKDGKRYNTDVADFKQLFRVIQSIPSRKAEPFKEWMAEVAAKRIDQQIDGERCLRKKRSRIMDQETRWLTRYNEVKSFIETNHRNPSKHRIEEHDMLNWMKANRKVMNKGDMKEERVERFRELMEMCERYRRKNQYI